MVIACLALGVALGGTSVAAIQALPKNSVGTKQLKKNAVISSKVKNRSLLAVDFKAGQLPQGPKGDPGAPGAPGAPGQQGPPGPGARWAAVRPNGTIAGQSGGITSTHVQTGVYRLDFGSDVSRQLILVSGGPVSDASFRGTIIAGSCAGPIGDPTLIGCGGVPSPETKVFVGALNSGDAATGDHGFYLAVMGPTSAAAGPMGPTSKLHGGFSAD